METTSDTSRPMATGPWRLRQEQQRPRGASAQVALRLMCGPVLGLVALAAVNCTTRVFVVAPTVAATPNLTTEQRAYVESVATQLARPTDTPVPPMSTSVPPTQTPVVIDVSRADTGSRAGSAGDTSSSFQRRDTHN